MYEYDMKCVGLVSHKKSNDCWSTCSPGGIDRESLWTAGGHWDHRDNCQLFICVCVCVCSRCFFCYNHNISLFGFLSYLHVGFRLVIQHSWLSVNIFSLNLINGKGIRHGRSHLFAQQRVWNYLKFPQVTILWIDCHYTHYLEFAAKKDTVLVVLFSLKQLCLILSLSDC